MKRSLIALAAILAACLARAQEPEAAAPAIESMPPAALVPEAVPTVALAPDATTGDSACCIAPAGTQVALEILDTLNSSRNKRGDAFAIRLLEPVVVNGMIVIPAGTAGTGEVVHTAAARSGGAPGELLIAARKLDLGDRSATLRGLKLGVTGGDNSGMALGVSFAAGPFAMFIRGREIEIPAGTHVVAKLAAAVTAAADATEQPATVAPTDPPTAVP